jgi:HAD superfamily hydrolase (TIGR01549 family)
VALRGVILDLGHTLMHLRGTWPEVFEQGVADLAAFLSARQPGLDAPAFGRALLERRREGFARASATLREVTAADSVRWAFARAGIPEPDPALVEGAIDAFFAYEDACWFPDPDALSVLRALAGRGLRLGVFSNATHDPFIQHVVDRLGFRPWLDPVLSSAGTGIRKPDPEAFSPFLAAWGGPPESIAVAGDTLDQDILGARRAGMRSVWLRPQAYARQEGGGYGDTGNRAEIVPDATIDRLGELPGCLETLASGLP